MPDEYLASLSFGDRESSWVQMLTADRAPASNLVAETDGGVIVGVAGGGPERQGDGTYQRAGRQRKWDTRGDRRTREIGGGSVQAVSENGTPEGIDVNGGVMLGHGAEQKCTNRALGRDGLTSRG